MALRRFALPELSRELPLEHPNFINAEIPELLEDIEWILHGSAIFLLQILPHSLNER
ncbi:MAG: hypothetical protein ACJAVK_003213 [Akkermansiaceae bacterium]|jgi:hypothetical protein